jgi:hypothetical protein
MHAYCFNEYLKTNFICPLCGKSLADLTDLYKNIDEQIKTHVLPDEVQNWKSDIFCNDCEKRSITKFHFMYHKCQHCESFATIIKNTIKEDEDEDDEEEDTIKEDEEDEENYCGSRLNDTQ